MGKQNSPGPGCRVRGVGAPQDDGWAGTARPGCAQVHIADLQRLCRECSCRPHVGPGKASIAGWGAVRLASERMMSQVASQGPENPHLSWPLRSDLCGWEEGGQTAVAWASARAEWAVLSKGHLLISLHPWASPAPGSPTSHPHCLSLRRKDRSAPRAGQQRRGADPQHREHPPAAGRR